MAGSFNGKLAVNPMFVELHGFVDHISVAPFISQVFKAQALFQIFGKLVAGYAVGDHRCAGMFFCDEGGCHGHYGIAADLTAILVYCR